jgi:hypothetical protein
MSRDDAPHTNRRVAAVLGPPPRSPVPTLDQRVYADNPPLRARLSNNTSTRRHKPRVKKQPCVDHGGAA